MIEQHIKILRLIIYLIKTNMPSYCTRVKEEKMLHVKQGMSNLNIVTDYKGVNFHCEGKKQEYEYLRSYTLIIA